MDRVDILGSETIKIKRTLRISAIRCIACGTWECDEFNHEEFDAIVTGETAGMCRSCKKAVLWAKEHMNDSD